MNSEILETSIQFQLYGKSAPVQTNNVAAVGLPLMNEMWRIVKESNIKTTGINHWVYLLDGQLFVGVALAPDSAIPEELEPCDFVLPRYLRHLHIGPYQALPAKWQALKLELQQRGETIGDISLEIYGHHCDDPAKLETTILIGLVAPKRRG